MDSKQQLLNNIIVASLTNDIQVNGVNVKCLIDTGSVISTISEYFVLLLVVKDTTFSREVPELVGTNILRNLLQHKRVNTLWRKNIKQYHHLINNIGKVYCEGHMVHPNSEVTTLWGKS